MVCRDLASLEFAKLRRHLEEGLRAQLRSDRPKDVSLWQIDRFVRELAQVRTALKLDEIVLYGASWGTMLGVDYMLTKPQGVKALILSSPCLSASRWKADTTRLLPGSRLVIFEQSSHMAMWEEEEASVATLRSFLREIDSL